MYNRKTVKATKKAIEKWEIICYAGGEDDECSLCDLFAYREEDLETGEEFCPGCPIYDFTGHDCMELAEYRKWTSLFYPGEPRAVLNRTSLEVAQAELEFIKKIYIKTLLLWDLNGETIT